MRHYAMWCNGFLQTLELRPRSPGNSCGPCPRFRVERLILSPSGRWNIATVDGGYREAVLAEGWISPGGSIMALAWRMQLGHRTKTRTYRAWFISRDHDSATWRRLVVRLRMPISLARPTAISG